MKPDFFAQDGTAPVSAHVEQQRMPLRPIHLSLTRLCQPGRMHQAALASNAATDQAGYVAGLHALRDGDLVRAMPLLQRAAESQPLHAGRRRNAIRALFAAGQYATAAEAARAALQTWPEDADLLFACGSALSETGDPATAIRYLIRARQIRPDHAPTCLNLANCHADLDDLPAAEELCRQAVHLDPTLPDVHAGLGTILTRQGRLPQALDAFDAALALMPAFPQAQWNRAVALLLAGDFRHGFAAFEWRRRHPAFAHWLTPPPGPEWTGEDPAGRTILVRAEQGAGDVIQFARYLNMLRDQGAQPVLCCAPDLIRLMRKSLPGIAAVGIGSPLVYDAWVNLGSLPGLFGTTPDTVPASSGYLAVDAARAQAWHKRLPPSPRVGLVFAGNPAHTGDRRRSIPPALFAPLLTLPGICFVNLQHGPLAVKLPLPDLTPALPDYAETAALVATLDLVITVDTSIAHLAGALGVPTWVMLPFAPDWRWMLHRSDSPWYRSLRLFRQPAPGAWAEVVALIISELRGLSFVRAT